MRSNGSHSHIVDRSLGVAVTVTGTIAVAYALKWLHDSLKRANNINRRLKSHEASSMFASMDNNNSAGDCAPSLSTQSAMGAAVDPTTAHARYGDENMVVHLGCCHCQRVQFKIFGPKVLNAVDISSKLRFPRISIVYEDFELLCDPSLLSMYTVQQPSGVTTDTSNGSGLAVVTGGGGDGHSPNTNPQVGIYTFCSYCGMHIIYAPSIDPVEVQINVDCLAADNIEQVHIAYHSVNDMVAANQIMDRRGIGALTTTSPMLPLFLHRQPKRVNVGGNSLEEVGLSSPVSSYSMGHQSQGQAAVESSHRSHPAPTGVHQGISSNAHYHLNASSADRGVEPNSYVPSSEQERMYHSNGGNRYPHDAHHSGSHRPQQQQPPEYYHNGVKHSSYYSQTRLSPYQEGLVEGDESILSMTSSTMDLDSATTGGVNSTIHQPSHHQHHHNQHQNSHSSHNIKKDPSLAPTPGSGYAYGGFPATAAYYPAPTQHMLQRAQNYQSPGHQHRHHPQLVRSYEDFYTQYYGEVPPSDINAALSVPPTATTAALVHSHSGSHSTTMVIDAEYDLEGDRYSVPSPVPSDSGESSNNTKDSNYHNYGYSYGRNVSSSRRASGGSSRHSLLQTPVLVGSASRSSSATTSPMNQSHLHSHWMNATPSPGPSPSHGRSSHGGHSSGKISAGVSPKHRSSNDDSRSHSNSRTQVSSTSVSGNSQQDGKHPKSSSRVINSPASVSSTTTSATTTSSSQPYYPAHIILPASSAKIDPQVAAMDLHQVSAYHQKLKRHLNRHTKSEVGDDIPVVVTAVEVTSVNDSMSVRGRESDAIENTSQSLEV